MALPAKHRAHIGKAGIFFAGAACTALVGVPTGLYVAQKSNTTMLVQQQQLSDLQNFESTGSALDGDVGQLSDAIIDGKGTEEARRSLRAAIATHSAAAFAMRDSLGAKYAPYASKLVELRSFADEAETPREAVQVFQSLADLVALRRKAALDVKAQVRNE